MADYSSMNGPRQSLESQTIVLDQDIWTPIEISSDSQGNELQAAARRLQERLLLCGCLDSDGNSNWIRTPSRKQSMFR